MAWMCGDAFFERVTRLNIRIDAVLERTGSQFMD